MELEQASPEELLLFAGVVVAYMVLGVILHKFVKWAWLATALMLLFGASVCGGFIYLLTRDF